MNRLLTTTFGVAAVALALTACGAEDPDGAKDGPTEITSESKSADADAGDLRNGPVPTADPNDAWEKDLPKEPGREAPVGDKIEFELLEATAKFAHHVDDKAVVECPDVKGDKDEDITCEATFFDQKVEWDVTITGGSMVVNYKYESKQRVLSREYIENALRFKEKTEDVKCELDEEFTVVDPENIDPVTCYSLKDGEQTTWELSVSGYGSASFYRQ